MQVSTQIIDPESVEFHQLQGGGVAAYIGPSVSLNFNSMNEAALWFQIAADKADALMAEREGFSESEIEQISDIADSVMTTLLRGGKIEVKS